MLNLRNLANPILRACDNLSDPAVWPTPDGYSLYNMVLMGEEPVRKRTTFGLFVSGDGLKWRALPAGTTPHE